MEVEETGRKQREGIGHKDGVWHVSKFGGVCVKEQWRFRLQALVQVDRAEQALCMTTRGPDKPCLFRRATGGNFGNRGRQIFHRDVDLS